MVLVGALLLGLLWTATAHGQERTALTKSGVTRLLTGDTYSPPEVAGIIRRSCLTFRPTRRDLDDFREIGADDEIIRAITTCAREREVGPSARVDSLRLPRSEIIAAAGDTVSLVARVWRNDRPQPGVRLVLEGTGEILRGPGRAPTAISDSAGRAVFRVPVGTEIGRFSLRVAPDDTATDLEGDDLVSLAVRAAAPFRARIMPDVLVPDEGREIPVVVRVRDRFGNPVRDAEVSFRARGEANGEVRWEGVTDRTGETRIEVVTAGLDGRESLGILVEGELLGVLPVRGAAAEVSPETEEARRAGAGERERDADVADPGELPEGGERADRGEPDAGRRGEERDPTAAPPLVEMTVLGAHTFHVDRVIQPQTAELAVWPVPALRIWGRYDDALHIEHPFLVRGKEDYRAFYVGTLVEWGKAERLRSLAELGRRLQPPGGVVQTLYRIEQAVLLGSGELSDFERFSLRLGGMVGHWHDRDDYVVELGAGIPVSPRFRLEPTFQYGGTVGTVSSRRRVPARETRLSVHGSLRPEAGWELGASLTTGDVDSEEERLSGALFDATLRATAPLGDGAGLRLFSRYQAPPGMEDFLEVGLGLTAKISR